MITIYTSIQIYCINLSTLSCLICFNLLMVHTFDQNYSTYVSKRATLIQPFSYRCTAFPCHKYIARWNVHTLQNLLGTFMSTVECPELAFGLLTAPSDTRYYSQPYTLLRNSLQSCRPSSRTLSCLTLSETHLRHLLATT